MGNENPLSVKVDLGIADVVRSVDAIFARRRDRKTESLADIASNLCDDLDVCSQIVKALDDLFVQLVGGFARGEIASEPALLRGHVEQTRQYLMRRELLTRLEEGIGAIKSAA